MAGRLRRLLLLLLRTFIHVQDLGAAVQVLHRQRGGSAELDPHLRGSVANLSRFYWKLGNKRIADTVRPDMNTSRFSGRLEFCSNSSVLKLRDLQVDDSGTYMFFSFRDGFQQATIEVTLQVHEPIKEKPSVTSNPTWNAINGSCRFLLSCRAAGHENVSYHWSLDPGSTWNLDPGSTWNRSQVQVQVWPVDGDTRANCTAFNPISSQSAEVQLQCRNSTSPSLVDFSPPMAAMAAMAAVGGALLVIMVSAAVVLHWKRKRAGRQQDDKTFYSLLSNVQTRHEGSSSVFLPIPSSRPDPEVPSRSPGAAEAVDTVYEVVSDVNFLQVQVYDQIQLHHLKTPPKPPPRRGRDGLDRGGAST